MAAIRVITLVGGAVSAKEVKMPQSKEVKKEQARLRMQKMRNNSVTKQSVTSDSVTSWETMPLKDIISALPQDIVDYIENVSRRYGLREQRLRRAYKYQVWHDENFINGIHKGSNYRQFVRTTE